MNSVKVSLQSEPRKNELCKSEAGKKEPRKYAALKHLAVNLLTGSRIIISPLFLICILSGASGWAAGLLALIYGTDIMDGYLARKWDAATRTGAWFDLTADIVFVILSSSALVIAGMMPFWFLFASAMKFAEFAATSYFLSNRSTRQVHGAVKEQHPRLSPVFDSAGRLSGILFMSAPVPALILYRILPVGLATIFFACFAVCTCGLSLTSSCYRLSLCVSMKSPKKASENLLYSR